jgi:hypothetical protein
MDGLFICSGVEEMGGRRKDAPCCIAMSLCVGAHTVRSHLPPPQLQRHLAQSHQQQRQQQAAAAQAGGKSLTEAVREYQHALMDDPAHRHVREWLTGTGEGACGCRVCVRVWGACGGGDALVCVCAICFGPRARGKVHVGVGCV